MIPDKVKSDMKKHDKVFAEIETIDAQILRSSRLNDSFAVRQRSDTRIALFSLSGHMINLVTTPHTCGPDFILCKRLPPLSEEITEDGWILYICSGWLIVMKP